MAEHKETAYEINISLNNYLNFYLNIFSSGKVTVWMAINVASGPCGQVGHFKNSPKIRKFTP